MKTICLAFVIGSMAFFLLPSVSRSQAIVRSQAKSPLRGRSPAGVNAQSVETEVAAIIAQMTVQQELDFIGGTGAWDVKPLPQFNLPQIHGTDGGAGVRLSTPVGVKYPAAVALAASWSVARAQDFGEALARDTKSGGFQEILAPGMDFYRIPFGGREAEYGTGEDPYLGAVLMPTVVNAIQSQGVWATVKHYVLNDQEANRFVISDNADERTLRELYYVPFESTVKSANPANVMCAFNRVNGQYACQNSTIETTVLKQQWGFQGFVASDYNAITDGLTAALAGTDIDMPSGYQMNAANLLGPVQTGALPKAILDDKVRRILREEFLFGFNGTNTGGPPTGGGGGSSPGSTPDPGPGGSVGAGIPSPSTTEYDDPVSEATSLNIANESIVLLTNPNHFLPLSPSTPLKIAVIGSRATGDPPQESGSAYYPSLHYISELSGIESAAAKGSTVDYLDYLSLDPSKTTSVAGFVGQYYSNNSFAGTPDMTRTDPVIDFDWTQGSPSNISASESIVWTGQIVPQVTGDHVFKIRGDGAVEVLVNGVDVVDNGAGAPIVSSAIAPDVPVNGKISLVAGVPATVQIRYARKPGYGNSLGGFLGVEFSWAALEPLPNLSAYDAVIVAAGLGAEYEGEGYDRPFDMPEFQQEMIANVAAANPHTVALIHAGGGVDMRQFVNSVAGLLYVWYPGQNGGKAVANILFGTVNPSGKLPMTLDAAVEDNPAYGTYPFPLNTPAATELNYSEGLFLGYRGYEKSQLTPLFPFGYGLSYSSFYYSAPSATVVAASCGNMSSSATTAGTSSKHTPTPSGGIARLTPGAPLLAVLLIPALLGRARSRKSRSGLLLAATAAVTLLFVGCSGSDSSAPLSVPVSSMLQVSFNITNLSSTTGSEIAEVYVGERNPAVPRPVKELKGFAKVTLAPGQTTRVTIPLNPRAFAYYDVTHATWQIDAAQFVISIGGSSNAISQTLVVAHDAESLSVTQSAPTTIQPLNATSSSCTT